MSSRDNILGRLRASRSPHLPPTELPSPPEPASGALPLLDPQRIEAFSSAMSAVHGEILQTSTEQWPQALFADALEHGVRNLMIARHSPFFERLINPPTGLSVLPYEGEFEANKSALFHDIDAGFSAATAGIAETGTLIVRTGKQEPRTLSLIPPVSYILLDAQTLYPDLPSAFADRERILPLPNNLLLISGPSKTADIQQTLAYGAHGPKRLVVLMLS